MVESASKEIPELNVDYDTVSTRFSVRNNEELQQGVEHLNETGYAVFSDVLTDDEVNHNIDLLWKYLESLKKPFQIQRKDPKTWNRIWPGAPHIGLLNDHGMGQSEFMWSIRGNPNIKRVFSQIWNSDELLVSFDGAGCFRNWHFNLDWKTIGGWYHCDQNPFTKPNRCSIQGLVALTDSDESTGGFLAIPNSHKHFAELTLKNRQPRDDFMRISEAYLQSEQMHARLIKCKAGDLIVWDSRCIHCNVPATVQRENANEPELLRAVAYVCMIPVSMFVPDGKKYKNLQEFQHLREKFVRDRITCTHWPLKLFGTRADEGFYFEDTPLKLNAFQHSLIVGTNVTPDNTTSDICM